MTEQARAVTEFGLWVDHFENNVGVHARVDAAIDFDGACAVPEALDAIGYRRVRFIREVLADFAKVAEAVLRR